MGEDTRILGARSRLVKSVKHAGMTAALNPNSTPITYYIDVANFCTEFDVPKVHRVELLEDLRVWGKSLGYDMPADPAEAPAPTEAKADSEVFTALPEPQPQSEPAPSAPSIFTPEEVAALFSDDEPLATPKSDRSPYHRVVQEYADSLSKACTSRDLIPNIPNLCKPLIVEGQKVFVLSTWRVRSDSGYSWNITGKPAESEGTYPVIHRCDENILLFHDNVRVCTSEDIKAVLQVPALWKDSAAKGSVQQVSISLFLWLLKYVPKRQFRFWVNEEAPKAAKGKDAYNWRFIMPPAFPL